MQAGLFDILTGSFGEGHMLAAIPEREHRIQSVMGNLNRLFNTRQGSVAHLPSYGLPDITTIYRDLPYSVDELRRAIKEAVETYEPRLRRISVKPVDTDRYSMRLSFILSAELIGIGRVRFQTTFSSNDLVQVDQYTNPY